jgi:hypothetical protein
MATMGVATQIAQHLQGTTEGRLGIDHPVVAVQTPNQFRELLGVGQRCGGTSAVSFFAAVEVFQTSQEFSTKDAAKDLHGQKERILRTDPSTVVCG